MNITKKGLALVAVLLAGTVVWAASPERYLHVRVTNPSTHELVRVNVPLSLAETVLPAINHGQLRNGKIDIGNFSPDKIDLKVVIEALKTAPEGEFVTVQQNDSDVRVAKEHDRLVVHVLDKQGKENVDVTVPWNVAQALIADTSEGQLNVLAAIKALQSAGDITLVTVAGHDESVRVWIDSSSSEK
jgi:hypothetical protein